MTRSRRGLLCLAVLAGGARALPAQERFISDARTVLTPSFASWKFADALSQDSIDVGRVSQIAFPVSVSFQSARWTVDVGGAVARGWVRTADGRDLDLAGLTDIRIRAVGRIIGDQLLVTAGLNLPTGKTGLSRQQLDVLRVLATPALGMPVPSLGLGAGGTAGLVYAMSAGDWGVAFGSSVEIRGNYSPVEARLAGAAAPTDLRPGPAVRFSFGADRLVGAGKFSLLLAADVYGKDRLSIDQAGGTVDGHYQLGPQLSATAYLDLAPRGMERLSFTVADRYRTRFAGIDGEKVAGSSGNYLMAAADGAVGVGRAASVFARLEGRLDGGLEVDQTITTAAANLATLTLGLTFRSGRATVEPFASIGGGRLDAGPAESSVSGFGAGLTVTIR